MNPKIGVVMGSTSDLGVMNGAFEMLDQFGIEYEKKVFSAHRTPVALDNWVTGARDRGIVAFIAAAGGAAHLAGVVAAHTTLPVIGVPIMSKALRGMDSLLATAQMPSGIPVATMAIDGAKNAAIFCAEILSVTDENIHRKLREFREEQERKILSTEI
ncbi:MAG: 5-(carboxyamino)imidazole ribonucleotide mutase [Muribaculaceae bacterium]|nr:5-(carboxyamino)imidazole ribonucleotide mutase [Muribaculaceae bacterium]